MKTQIKSAIISTLLMAILSVLAYIIAVGSVYKVEIRVLIDTGVISLATGFVSLIKSFFTTDSGHFVGVVKVKE